MSRFEVSLFAFMAVLVTTSATRSELTLAHRVPETLSYRLSWGVGGVNLITAGTARFELAPGDSIGGDATLKLRSLAHSVGFVDWAYPVSDTIDVLLNRRTFRPISFRKRLHEASYHDDRWAEYDHETGAISSSRGDTVVEGNVRDILSALYIVRTESLFVGAEIAVEVHDDGRVYSLSVNVLRREQASVEAGEFDCFVVEPTLRSSGVAQLKGRLVIWISDDRDRLPVLMRSSVPIGAIEAELIAVPNGPAFTTNGQPDAN